VINNSSIYELKTAELLTSSHKLQLLSYLLLTNNNYDISMKLIPQKTINFVYKVMFVFVFYKDGVLSDGKSCQ